jgi:hypothetical protein
VVVVVVVWVAVVVGEEGVANWGDGQTTVQKPDVEGGYAYIHYPLSLLFSSLSFSVSFCFSRGVTTPSGQ